MQEGKYTLSTLLHDYILSLTPNDPLDSCLIGWLRISWELVCINVFKGVVKWVLLVLEHPLLSTIYLLN